VLSQFVGIWTASLVYFFIYAVATGNRPKVFAETAAPAVVSGVLWAIAQVAWFLANENLSYVESFPIITLLPSAVASLWGVFLYGEIQGTRNYLLLAAYFVLAAATVSMIVISSPKS